MSIASITLSLKHLGRVDGDLRYLDLDNLEHLVGNIVQSGV